MGARKLEQGYKWKNHQADSQLAQIAVIPEGGSLQPDFRWSLQGNPPKTQMGFQCRDQVNWSIWTKVEWGVKRGQNEPR